MGLLLSNGVTANNTVMTAWDDPTKRARILDRVINVQELPAQLAFDRLALAGHVYAGDTRIGVFLSHFDARVDGNDSTFDDAYVQSRQYTILRSAIRLIIEWFEKLNHSQQQIRYVLTTAGGLVIRCKYAHTPNHCTGEHPTIYRKQG
jgi:hypothetical protein